jgi:IclR family acetate operon transcriptional repressor
MMNKSHHVKNAPAAKLPPAAPRNEPGVAGVNKGTVKVFNVLSLFAQQPSWGVTEISRTLGCAKNTAFQALDTLVKEGLVVRDHTGQRYQLGHAVMDFVGDGEALDVRELCRPYLARLHALTGASVFISIVVGRYNVCLESIQPQGVTVGYSPLSQPIPLHAGAGSRMLLAYLHDAEIQRYIEIVSPLQRITPTTITEPAALWDEVHLIRRQGFARGYEDFATGATFLSFPVFGALDRPLAAIVIGGPINSFTRAVADGFIPAIRTIMAELNQHSRMFPAVPIVRF